MFIPAFNVILSEFLQLRFSLNFLKMSISSNQNKIPWLLSDLQQFYFSLTISWPVAVLHNVYAEALPGWLPTSNMGQDVVTTLKWNSNKKQLFSLKCWQQHEALRKCRHVTFWNSKATGDTPSPPRQGLYAWWNFIWSPYLALITRTEGSKNYNHVLTSPPPLQF